MPSKVLNWALNTCTVVVTICAIVVGGLRVRAALSEAKTGVGPRQGLRTVANWREFGREGVRLGPTQARVTIVEFLDFQCPFCRVASGELKDLRRWYKNDLAVIYRHLPIHKFAKPAAVAAECAARAGAFEALHDLFFAESDSIGSKPLTRFALEAGILDTAQFAECLRDQSVASVIRRDSAAAVALGIKGTPTFLINDLLVPGNPGFEQLYRYVKSAFKESQP